MNETELELIKGIKTNIEELRKDIADLYKLNRHEIRGFGDIKVELQGVATQVIEHERMWENFNGINKDTAKEEKTRQRWAIGIGVIIIINIVKIILEFAGVL